MAWHVESRRLSTLDRVEMERFAALAASIWSPGEPPDVDKLLAEAATPDSELRSDEQAHMIRAGERVIAAARSFRRIVSVAGDSFPILALAGVCADERWRGQGLGAAVVRGAWARLDGPMAVSLFQTAVPDFYRKLGARCLSVAIVRSGHAARPFWDPFAMIFPAEAAWPEGPVDIRGPGW